jgi:CRP-like cAMP-binding protein
MELSEVRNRILNTPLVKNLPESMRNKFAMQLLWIAQTEEVSREQNLFVQGDKDSDYGCLILEGMVRIITEKSNKKTIDAPDILGEVQLFTPQGERTATVEVVVGGEILTFSWKEFGNAARENFSEEEMATLKKVIADSAWTRQEDLMEKIKEKRKNGSGKDSE